MTDISKKNTTCRSCGSDRLVLVLDLGITPLANSYLSEDQLNDSEPFVPLEVYFCEGCGLVQLIHVVDAESMFRYYLYVPSASETLRRHFGGLAQDLADVAGLQPGDLVVEIASNDGLLLKQIRALGYTTLGVEPASNIAAKAREEEGLDVIDEFFDSGIARRIRAERGPAKAIVGTNVLAHVDDVRDFLGGVEHLLADNGVVGIEAPHLLALVENCEFDTVYHEHLSYFSLRALIQLYASVGLTIFKVRQMPVNGGSIRFFASKTGAREPDDDSVERLLQVEKEHGLDKLETYHAFAERVEVLRRDLRELVAGLKQQGKRIGGYGAAAKGMTMLAYCGLGAETLEYVIDKSPYKYGRFTPGSHLPILPAEKLLTDPPDYLLILAWNLADEIMAQQDAFKKAGGHFILPVPTPRVI